MLFISYAIVPLCALNKGKTWDRQLWDNDSGPISIPLPPSSGPAWTSKPPSDLVKSAKTQAADSGAVVWAQCDELFRYYPFGGMSSFEKYYSKTWGAEGVLLFIAFLNFLIKSRDCRSRKTSRGAPNCKS